VDKVVILKHNEKKGGLAQMIRSRRSSCILRAFKSNSVALESSWQSMVYWSMERLNVMVWVELFIFYF